MKTTPELDDLILARGKDNRVRPLVPSGRSKMQKRFRAVGLGVEIHQFNELENLDTAPLSTTLGFNLSDPVDVEFKSSARWYTETFGYYDVGIYSADVPFSARLRASNRGILVSLDDGLFRRLFPDHSRKDLLDLDRPLVTKDIYLAESLRLIAKHAEGVVGSSSLYAETIAASMAVHLISRYGTPDDAREKSSRSLTSRDILPKVNAYLAEHLSEDIRLTTLASLVDLSPFHFSRLFKACTGTSPYRYVMDRRLDKGIELLRQTRQPISQIALEVGFCDQSHFTREMTRSFGVTPKEVRDETA